VAIAQAARLFALAASLLVERAGAGAMGGNAAAAPPRAALRVVFLDIDGVLLPFGEPPAGAEGAERDVAGNNAQFPARCLASLQRILRETGARLVRGVGGICPLPLRVSRAICARTPAKHAQHPRARGLDTSLSCHIHAPPRPTGPVLHVALRRRGCGRAGGVQKFCCRPEEPAAAEVRAARDLQRSAKPVAGH